MLNPADLVQAYGLWAVFGTAMLESMGLPLPSESVLIAAAVVAGSHAGEPTLAALIGAATAGAILGDNIAYEIGQRAGLPLLRRYGPYIGIGARRLRLGRYLFQRYGGRIVFFGRFISVLRTAAALLAGLNRMPRVRFMTANALGAVAWAATVASTAFLLGAHAHEFSKPVLLAGTVLAVVIVVAVAITIRRQEGRLQLEADKAFGTDRS